MMKLCLTLATLAVGAVLAASPASAQTKICTGSSLPAGTYVNVLVPSSNPSCSLGTGVIVTGNVTDQGFLNLNAGAVVDGNVMVTSGATLRMPGGTVHGSVSSNNALHIEIGSATVGTNVLLAGTTNGIIITGSIITGSLTITGTQSGPIEVVSATVSTNVLLSGNKTSGSAPNDLVAENAIGGNLTCVANIPAPVNSGVLNTVTGNEVGQCVGL